MSTPAPASTQPPPSIALLLLSGMLVFGLGALIHEGLGHGVTSYLMGCTPVSLTSAYWEADCTPAADPHLALLLRKAGGTVANLLVAALAAGGLLALRRRRAALRSGAFLLWLLAVTNALSAFGYLMTDPLLRQGDWARFLEALGDPLPLRIALIAIGVAGSFATLYLGRRALLPWLGTPGPERRARSIRLALLPYLAGATLVTASALANPLGLKMVLSAGLANFAGCSWMIWIAFDPLATPSDHTGLLQAAPPWLIAASVLLIAFTLLGLGPGITW